MTVNFCSILYKHVFLTLLERIRISVEVMPRLSEEISAAQFRVQAAKIYDKSQC